jgi:DNA-binding LytR/AlgR family response regulator
MANPAVPIDRVLLHLKGSRRVVLEPDEVYYLEAAGDETIVRKRGRRTLLDVRSLAEVMAALTPFHFHRVHDKWAVNLRRVREIRLQRDGRDWEVVLRPPVNRVIPVSRGRQRGLLRRLGSSP